MTLEFRTRVVCWIATLMLAVTIVFYTASCTKRPSSVTTTPTTKQKTSTPKRKIAFVMKLVGIPYTNACTKGMEQAAKELNIDAVFLGPPNAANTIKQIETVEDQISRGVDAIIVSPNDDKAFVPVIKKGMDKGVKMFTWDSDAPDSKRIFYVAAADDVGIGIDIIDHIAKDIGGKGKVAIMSGGPNALNLNLHVKGVEQGAKKYPGIQIVKPYLYNNDDPQQAISQAVSILQRHPDLAAFACVNSPGAPGAARALIQTGKEGKAKIWGLSTPKENREFLKSGVVNGLILWDPAKLTYLTTKLVNDYLDGKKPQDGMDVPDIGKLKVSETGVVIMPGVVITKENVDQFDF